MKTDRIEDKRYLTELLDHLDVSSSRLKRDGCLDWNIVGRKGHIFTDTVYWYAFVNETTKRKWSSIKHKLSFMELNQDGDDEGILKLERMPSYEEAEVIREIIGLNKRPAMSEAHLEYLRGRISTLGNNGVLNPSIDLNEKEQDM
jgi:hypothetical protein